MSPPIRWIHVKKTRSEAQFFAFVRERIKILERRRAGRSSPWTNDPVLRRYRFTNINRRADTGTQFYLKNIMPKLGGPDLVFNTIVYRLFNRIRTFEAHGILSAERYRPSQIYGPVSRLNKTEPVFTKAFQVCPMFEGIKTGNTIRNYALLSAELAKFSAKHWEQMLSQPNLISASKFLERQKGMGSFIAPQIVADLSYSEHARFSEEDPVLIARGGSRWALSDIYGFEAPEVHQVRFEKLARRAKLTQMECENALCEFSKYVRLTDGRTKSARIYRPHG